MYNPYAVGERIYLRAPTLEDAEGKWHEWLSDEETTRGLVQRYWPNTVQQQREFYESSQKSRDRLVLSIVDKATDQHIGVGSLSGIDWLHRYADIAIIIGDKSFRHGPYVLEGMSLMLSIAFLRLNMRIVKSVYSASNEASQKMHDIFHFKQVGRIPSLYWDRGQYTDSVISILNGEDWMARNAKKPSA